MTEGKLKKENYFLEKEIKSKIKMFKKEIILADYKMTGKYVKAKMMNFNSRGILYPSRKKLNAERSLNIRRRKVRV